MSEALHAWAIAPAALGVCCVVADRNARFLNLASSVLMSLAMLDVWLMHAVAPILWSSVMLTAAIGLSIVRRNRNARVRHGVVTAVTAHNRDASLHMTLGMVVMAGLLLAMNSPAPSTQPSAVHVHGGSGGLLIPALLVAAGCYAVYGVACAFAAKNWLERAQYTTMSVSVLTMAISMLL